jgi:4-nitrophenol 2-monooxygenase / 4-nitrocatechol 4-monooxygenase, reductase component
MTDVTPVADQQVFRDVIGRFTSGVTVITTAVDGVRFGTTASAFSSLSMEPPMVLVCLNKTSETQAAVLKAGAFAVNILSEGQQDVAYRFARKGDKFGDLEHDTGRRGVPVLRDTLAHLECEVGETVTGGTHTVFLARVTLAAGHDGTPLTYYRGRFGRLESVREEEAYQAVRHYVLDRRCTLDQPLEPAEVAQTLGIDPTHATYALIRLASDHVVSRTPDSRFVPTPLTVEIADQVFSARSVVELGVADSTVGRIADDDLAVLDGFATRLAHIVADDTSTLAQFLDASDGYHRHFVGLGRSPQLSDTYDRLGITALWRKAIAAHDWRHRFDVSHHAALTRACRDRDAARARQLIIEHTEQVRRLVRDVIDRAGGAL